MHSMIEISDVFFKERYGDSEHHIGIDIPNHISMTHHIGIDLPKHISMTQGSCGLNLMNQAK